MRDLLRVDNETAFVHGFCLFYIPAIPHHSSTDLFLKDKPGGLLLTIICSVGLTYVIFQLWNILFCNPFYTDFSCLLCCSLNNVVECCLPLRYCGFPTYLCLMDIWVCFKIISNLLIMTHQVYLLTYLIFLLFIFKLPFPPLRLTSYPLNEGVGRCQKFRHSLMNVQNMT